MSDEHRWEAPMDRVAAEAIDHAANAIEWEADSIMIEPEVGGWLMAIAGWLRDNGDRVIAEIRGGRHRRDPDADHDHDPIPGLDV